uniref:Carnosic acid synthase n=1 Tax=Rosmarinus officinalis TaxID=39367 RepID=C76K8_ROSOF|nr:RecName: Full=Carnosic acid synthase; AltName: Full=Cytochrome P450 76AK8; Short=RoCYP76AK8; AltName: Full=Miltiradien-20-al synthase; AltName: Full=Pisiferic acid synthase [Salvia rosmarinus]AOW42546.1 cytochrome P450 76AK8 [Salvia rosmarinus]
MQLFIILSLAFIAAWVVYSRWSEYSRGRQGGSGGLPPGPPRLPIIGNILQLGRDPHKSLAQLAKTYGPLMSLKLGNQFAVVVSSPEMAREILQKQGLIFSKPFTPSAVRVLGHNDISMNMLPASSDRWKKLRRVAREQLFSNPALQATQDIRQERLRQLTDYASRCCAQGRAMNVGEATFTTMTNLMFATLFSVELTQYGATDTGSDKKFKEHVNALTRYMGVPNVADFFPFLAPLDPQGMRRKLTYHLGSLLELVQSLIQQRLQARNDSTYQKKNDFLDTLLDLSEGNEYDLSIKEIKHMFVDLIIAGSDTSAATTEWAMVELLLHPDKMAKLKAELKSVLGEKSIVEESDISRLPYLLATVKEVLRYHPAAPLLAPHAAEEETQVSGYIIPKNTKMFINVWSITRDPSIWKNPESFEPERFLDSEIDFGGQHFELIPFGSGRRICPGMPLASRMLQCMVATLCHNFDWELEKGAESKQLQREDVFGLALQKKIPLRAVPIKV